jgi:hypothetical protein
MFEARGFWNKWLHWSWILTFLELDVSDMKFCEVTEIWSCFFGPPYIIGVLPFLE